MKLSFSPVVNSASKVAILGSMPSAQSLLKREYYGNERNHFWRLIYSMFDRPYDETYENRIRFVLEHHIALWDVLKSCDREGSSDSKITNPVPNDIYGLLRQYPSIRAIFLNGSAAFRFFEKMILPGIKTGDIVYHKLPSSSPARAMEFNDKLREWEKIRKYI